MLKSVLRACDICHAKKIKCDRNNPCKACRDNSLDCTRDRPRPQRQMASAAGTATTQPNDERFEAMLRRLNQLEDTIASQSTREGPRHHTPTAAAPTTTALPTSTWAASTLTAPSVPPHMPRSPSFIEPGVSGMIQTNDQEDHQSPLTNTSRSQNPGYPKRRRVSVATSYVGSSKSSLEEDLTSTGQSPLLRQAQRHLKDELCRSESSLNQERHHLFHSGLELAQSVEVEGTESGSIELEETANFYNESMYPPPDFLYYTLNSLTSRSVITPYYLYLGSHLSKTTLEKMELALVENTVHGQRRLEYVVCVNFWAFLSLTSIETDDPSSQMACRLGGTRDRYLSNAKQALNHMGIMATPTLSTLQALLSGVMLYLDVGDFEKCWILNSAACRAYTALGGHYIAERATESDTPQAQEVRACFFYCYVFDKSFAIDIDRPCSLPDMEITVGSMILTNENKESSEVCAVLLKMVQIMDTLIKERRARSEGDAALAKVMRIHNLLDSLDSVKELVNQNSESTPSSDKFLKGEWMAMQFTFHSLRASLLDLMLSTKYDSETYNLRLASARRALVALKSMQDNTWAQFMRSKAFASSLTWTILIFPFIAFFVVFSNVVLTADLADLRLLRDVADGFSVVSTDSPTICKVEAFCKRLVKLSFETITMPRLHSIAAKPPPVPRTAMREDFFRPGLTLKQHMARPHEMNRFNVGADQNSSHSVAATLPRAGLDGMMPSVEGMGTLVNTAAPLTPGDSYGQIWRLLESQWDDFLEEQ